MQCTLALCGATTTTTLGRDCAAGMQLLNALAMSSVLLPAAGPRGLLLAGWGRRLRECPTAPPPSTVLSSAAFAVSEVCIAGMRQRCPSPRRLAQGQWGWLPDPATVHQRTPHPTDCPHTLVLALAACAPGPNQCMPVTAYPAAQVQQYTGQATWGQPAPPRPSSPPNPTPCLPSHVPPRAFPILQPSWSGKQTGSVTQNDGCTCVNTRSPRLATPRAAPGSLIDHSRSPSPCHHMPCHGPCAA
jgi:hypothetical protein